jgi:hypothetical protein
MYDKKTIETFFNDFIDNKKYNCLRIETDNEKIRNELEASIVVANVQKKQGKKGEQNG